MIAVLFQATPKPQTRATYLELAGQLAQELAQIEGFVSIERFESLSSPGKLLSLSYWTNEDAVARWRQHPDHRAAQELGARTIFASYTIHVASVIRHYGSGNIAREPTAP